MRTFRQECLSAATVLSVPAAICLAFPFESLFFRGSDAPGGATASAAFVMLSPEEESAALRAARTAWQSDESTDRRMRIRLPLGELPEDAKSASFKIETEPLAQAAARPVAYPFPAWLPSQRASDPVRLPSGEGKRDAPAFSREELLKID